MTKKVETKAGLQPCGTWAAVMRHYRHGEELDDACREARNEHMREIYWARKENLKERGIKRRSEPNRRARPHDKATARKKAKR